LNNSGLGALSRIAEKLARRLQLPFGVSGFDESRPNDGWLTVLRPTADDQTFGIAAR
tara:strand:+ start:180 stop:350 length:171 start_codon:yes stop_codon:yes gene_type:complete